MDGCQNYGPLGDPCCGTAPVVEYPKKGHNFDNHPYEL